MGEKKFITSALCVVDFDAKKLSKEFSANQVIDIGYGLQPSKSFVSAKISSVNLHSNFDEYLRISLDAPLDLDDLRKVTDLAVIKVAGLTPNIEVADILEPPSSLGSAVVAGYGLPVDPFDQKAATIGVDLYWHPFEINHQDEKRFYSVSTDQGAGAKVVQILAGDRGGQCL